MSIFHLYVISAFYVDPKKATVDTERHQLREEQDLIFQRLVVSLE